MLFLTEVFKQASRERVFKKSNVVFVLSAVGDIESCVEVKLLSMLYRVPRNTEDRDCKGIRLGLCSSRYSQEVC